MGLHIAQGTLAVSHALGGGVNHYAQNAQQSKHRIHHCQQLVTETKLDELTREVREHNGFAKRMPVVEEQIKVINHRLLNLERKECK